MKKLFYLLTLLCATRASAADISDRVFINVATVTNYLRYSTADAYDQLPERITRQIDGNYIDDKESDALNYSLAVGYYLSDYLAIWFSGTSGIEIAFNGSACSIFCAERSDTEVDLNIFELGGTLYPLAQSDVIRPYIEGAVVLNHLRSKVHGHLAASYEREVIASSEDFAAGVKAGLGVQFDYADAWSLRLGYDRYSFMEINRVYAGLQVRF